ncbi:TetR/AcrR family transcriptional regulator [Deminuibacter soli]|uniref:TetR/AcrR family transcriptional regulator n=1 Tax=Deminuibacter soli TaxID=2291815 RepID=A0A3E1NI64_9BACT|nr:TetR/AcrR family transcriptional regulator [Deminuibacter soli]RFM27623.1 TetR/AcrR family transcriptional regulator [Deminuibacter soli]
MNVTTPTAENCLNVEAAIKSAARKVFLRDGLKGARLQEIADIAGINRAMLHYYFRSKENLFEMVFKEVIEKMYGRLNTVLRSSLPIREKIVAFAENFVCDALENPDLDGFFINEFAQHPELLDQLIFCNGKDRPMLLFKKEIEEANARGEIKADATMLIMNMLSLCAFPFVAKNMFQRMFSLSEAQMEQLIKERLTMIQQMLLDSVKAD